MYMLIFSSHIVHILGFCEKPPEHCILPHTRMCNNMQIDKHFMYHAQSYKEAPTCLYRYMRIHLKPDTRDCVCVWQLASAVWPWEWIGKRLVNFNTSTELALEKQKLNCDTHKWNMYCFDVYQFWQLSKFRNAEYGHCGYKFCIIDAAIANDKRWQVFLESKSSFEFIPKIMNMKRNNSYRFAIIRLN